MIENYRKSDVRFSGVIIECTTRRWEDQGRPERKQGEMAFSFYLGLKFDESWMVLEFLIFFASKRGM
jgi:hypothetical protein